MPDPFSLRGSEVGLRARLAPGPGCIEKLSSIEPLPTVPVDWSRSDSPQTYQAYITTEEYKFS
jgi:hypothetical protein